MDAYNFLFCWTYFKVFLIGNDNFLESDEFSYRGIQNRSRFALYGLLEIKDTRNKMQMKKKHTIIFGYNRLQFFFVFLFAQILIRNKKKSRIQNWNVIKIFVL